MNITKLFYWVSMLGILTFFVSALVVIFWLIYPYKVIEFKDAKFPITKTAKGGDTIYYISKYCKYMNVTSTVSRNFVDGILYTVPTVNGTRPTGCHTVSVGVDVPKELPDGIYHLELEYVYDVNPIRQVRIRHSTENFTVTGDLEVK